MLKPALVSLLLLAGCSFDPCSDAGRAALVAVGGPVGAIVAALEQCALDAPHVGLDLSGPPDAGSADMAAAESSDLALNIVRDMTVLPDLSPVTQTLFAQGSFFWTTDNGAVRNGSAVTTPAQFDFAKAMPIYAGITIPVFPLNFSPEKFKTRELSASLKFDVAWGVFDSTYCPILGQTMAYLVKTGTNQACTARYVGFEFYVNGVAVYSTSAPASAHMAFSLPSAVPVLPAQTLAFKVLVNGNAVVSNFNASVSVKQSY